MRVGGRLGQRRDPRPHDRRAHPAVGVLAGQLLQLGDVRGVVVEDGRGVPGVEDGRRPGSRWPARCRRPARCAGCSRASTVSAGPIRGWAGRRRCHPRRMQVRCYDRDDAASSCRPRGRFWPPTPAAHRRPDRLDALKGQPDRRRSGRPAGRGTGHCRTGGGMPWRGQQDPAARLADALPRHRRRTPPHGALGRCRAAAPATRSTASRSCVAGSSPASSAASATTTAGRERHGPRHVDHGAGGRRSPACRRSSMTSSGSARGDVCRCRRRPRRPPEVPVPGHVHPARAGRPTTRKPSSTAAETWLTTAPAGSCATRGAHGQRVPRRRGRSSRSSRGR